jgi:hypothetical protein
MDGQIDKGYDSMTIAYGLAAFFLFILPFVAVSLPSVPAWLGRAIATSCFMFFSTVGILWFGLSPKSRVIGRSGKINQPQFDRVRPTIERIIRTIIVAFGVFFFFELTLPFATDLFHLARGMKPERITAGIIYRTVPLGGLWFLKQSVRFTRDAVSYSLFYSWQPIRVGESYEFVVLPRSRVILEFQPIGTG